MGARKQRVQSKVTSCNIKQIDWGLMSLDDVYYFVVVLGWQSACDLDNRQIKSTLYLWRLLAN